MSLPRRGGGTLKQADYYDDVATPKRGRDSQINWLLWSCRYPEEGEELSNKLITMIMSLPRRGGGDTQTKWLLWSCRYPEEGEGHSNKLITMIMSLLLRGGGTLKQADYYDHVATPKRGRDTQTSWLLWWCRYPEEGEGLSNKLITMIMSLLLRGGGTLKQADYYDHVATPKRGRDTQTSWLLWWCRYPEEGEGLSNKLITMIMSLPRRGGGTLKQTDYYDHVASRLSPCSFVLK